ncbi:MAG: mannonate dehydratase [Tannerella sp.]|jgi:mannonate dehydratase|nr:mannonate dehydratase [Tannerella sp.]
MALEKTWRWFGKNDSVPLSYLKQMGIEGVVTALHHLHAGDVWTIEEIMTVKSEIEGNGMRWSVVESLPVAEGIKIHSSDYPRLIDNYKQSLHNLGTCGIDTVCYNFMPVLDWARTDLHFKNQNGGESMLFDYPTFAAFDIYILKRKGASESYDDETLRKAETVITSMNDAQKEELAHNIIIVTQAFINGTVDKDASDYKQQFLNYLETYKDIGKEELRGNLSAFLNDVIPVAEEAGINLCIHADDPPFPLLGLPRIAGTTDDFLWIINRYDSTANGVTFCTGSLSGRDDNDLVAMAKALSSRIHFVHLRNTVSLQYRSFYESEHLNGNVDMYSVIKVLLEEQAERIRNGRKDVRMPFRPDHGIRIMDDYNRTANPGYPLYGRLKGLAEIDGMQHAIERMINNRLKKIHVHL